MKNIIIISLCALAVCILLTVNSCKKDKNEIWKEKVTGTVQKGPFVNGTNILMSELSSALEQTGKTFSSQILNNAGTFEIPDVGLSSSYVRLSANGYYFDEVKGELSVSPLNLLAVSDLTNITSVNVNILTHLEKQRVEYLVGTNVPFSTAKATAQAELLSAFGMSSGSMEASEALDISEDSEGNAILLAISVILQDDLSVGDLTELLAGIINDIRTDGTIDDEALMAELRASAMNLYLPDIRSHLENRYSELGVSASIPPFEDYINDFLAYTGEKPTLVEQKVTSASVDKASIGGAVNPNSLSSQVTVDYGTTSGYGSTVTATQSPVTGFLPVDISAFLTNLTPNTTYHYRVTATNSKGTTYGPDQTFVTLSAADYVTDVDGNTYSTVRIGSQMWMAGNLRTTKYNDNTPIPKVVQQLEWGVDATPAYCWYNNDSATYAETYGALYNFYVVNTGKLCPDGWHVPVKAEWDLLISFLGGKDIAGAKMKETGTIHWQEPNAGATDESGFNGVPSGTRLNTGQFSYVGVLVRYWGNTLESFNTMTWGYMRTLRYDDAKAPASSLEEAFGASVRCVRDND